MRCKVYSSGYLGSLKKRKGKRVLLGTLVMLSARVKSKKLWLSRIAEKLVTLRDEVIPRRVYYQQFSSGQPFYHRKP